MQWVGDVLIEERQPGRVAWWSSVTSANGQSIRSLDVTVFDNFRETACVQVRVEGLDRMCIRDQLCVWRKGDPLTKRLDLEEELGCVFLRAWVDGDLALEEASCPVRGFSAEVRTISTLFTIRDRLTEKLSLALKGRPGGANTLSRAEAGAASGLSTTIARRMESEPLWAGLNRTAELVQDVLAAPTPKYTYFPAGAVGRADAILHFAKLISAAECGYLIDPWFDRAGAESLLLRMQGRVKLTVLTNLPSPDHAEAQKDLSEFLSDSASLGLSPDLRVVLVAAARRDEQVFHDRFLVLQKGGTWTGYVLTNSFSGLASKYPAFVVEAAPGTTALLLAEAERLLELSNAEYKQLWPQQRAAAGPTTSGDRSGRFAGWRSLLRGLMPGPHRSDEAYVREGEARGFVQLREGKLHWRMSPHARDKTVGWLLRDARLRTKPLRRSRSERRRGPLPRQISIGRGVLTLGELRARGFDVKASEIAARVGVRFAVLIEQALRATFRENSDPTVARGDTSVERLTVRQTIAHRMPFWRGFSAGMSLWGARLHDPVRNTRWGRCFAYAVLMYIDPRRAVQLCEELFDADLPFAMVGLLHGYADAWSDTAARALADANSPALRGLGVQCLAHQEFAGRSQGRATLLVDVRRATQALTEHQIPLREKVLAVAAWGVDARGALLPEVVAALVAMLENVHEQILSELSDMLFEEELPNSRFLLALAEGLSHRDGAFVASLAATLVRRFAKRFREREWVGDAFSAAYENLTVAMASFLSQLSTQNKTSPHLEIERVVDAADIAGELVPLSPVRKRPATGDASAALGWLRLWEALAITGQVDESARTEAVARATEYLATPQYWQAKPVRKAIVDVLSGRFGATTSVLGSDDDESE